MRNEVLRWFFGGAARRFSSRRGPRLGLRIVSALWLTALAWPAGAQQLVVNDGDFVDWFDGFTFAGGSSTTLASGGNPGAYRALILPGVLSTVGTFQTASGWDPAVDGPLDTVRFRADIIGTNAPLDLSQPTLVFAFTQGGGIYAPSTAEPAFDLMNWGPVESVDLAQADFEEVNAGTPPDFSASGDPIRFGFLGGAVNEAGTSFSIDNFEVVVNAPGGVAVPGLAPAGIGLGCLALGLVTIGVWQLSARARRSGST